MMDVLRALLSVVKQYKVIQSDLFSFDLNMKKMLIGPPPLRLGEVGGLPEAFVAQLPEA